MSAAGSSKIKILFLGANPSNTTHLALGKEAREIMDRLRAAHQGGQFEFVQEWAVRVGDLQAALLRHRPHVVHFSGHGRGEGDAFAHSGPLSYRDMLPEDTYTGDNEGAILVEDDATGKARPLPAAALARLFKLVGGIRWVVLNACHSASQAYAICEHVEAVISMRRSIRDDAAIHFAGAFYQALGFGQPVESAFEFGKNRIEFDGRGESDIPLLLTKNTSPTIRLDEETPVAPMVTGKPARPPDLIPGERADPFLLQVEHIAKLRLPGARMKRRTAPRPFVGVLEVEVDAGGFSRMSIIAALDAALTEELANRFCADIDRTFRANYPQLRATLVHRGHVAPLALRARLDLLGIELQTFDGYQGLFDLQPYIEWQSWELEKNLAYQTSAYVDPPAWIKIAGNRDLLHTTNALDSLSELLATPQHRRFLLVLGEFGAGKTFLLRELCRQMARTHHPVVPVLLEMSKLEKQHSLAELLGAHFARADVPGYNFKAFEYMLGEGRIALFFDGFDELADKVTYDSATQHLDTVLSAVRGQAKVVLSSRRQHFLTEGDIHQAVEREFARKAESAVQGGYRLIMLAPFAEPQIQRYLRNVLVDEAAAQARYRLLDEVKDLIGLSHNPRMLSFIADIPEESLRQAKEQWGEITAAKLYEILVDHWLDFEYARSRRQGSSTRLSRQALLRGVESLALSLWQTRSKTTLVSEIHERIAQALSSLGEPSFDPAVLAHIFGSGSLLVRDEDGRFSFVHRSVMEWLVAKQAADELSSGREPQALVADEMSALMADFFAAMAGRERAATWAREKLTSDEELMLRKNATLLLTRMGERFERVNFERQDLRGKDFSGVDWRGANLRGVDFRGAMLRGANLRGASLNGANLSHADLRGANLSRVEFTNADLSFVRAEGADFSGAELQPRRFRGANLLGAKGIPATRHTDLLAGGAVPPVLQKIAPMYGNGSACRSIAWDPDGSMLVSGHEDGTIRLVDVVLGKMLRILDGHIGKIYGVAFSPDGEMVASASDDKTVRLWNVATGEVAQTFAGHTAPVRAVAFAPDGKSVLSGGDDMKVHLWDVETGRCLLTFEGHTFGIRSVAISADGTQVASGAKDGTVRLWKVQSAQVRRVLSTRSATAYGLAFAPDGKTIATGSSRGLIQFWDTASGYCHLTFDAHMQAISSLAFSPNGKLLASGSRDRTIRLWEAPTGRPVGFEGRHSEVLCVAFSPDGAHLASATHDGTVHMWHVNTSRKTQIFAGYPASVRSVAFSPRNNMFAAGSSNNIMRLWDPSRGRVVRSYESGASNVRKIVFSPDGKTLAGASSGTIWFWDAENGQALRCFESYSQEVYGIDFSPDGKYLVLGANGRQVKLWDVDDGTLLRTFDGHTSAIYTVAYSSDGKMIASGSGDTTVRLWEVKTGRILGLIDWHTSAILSVAFTPDCTAVASSSYHNTIQLWDVATGRSLRSFAGHSSAVRNISFSRDGQWLASASYDNTVRIWEAATGHTARVFEGHTAAVLTVAFSPDGQTIASGSYDNTVRLWDVASGQCLAILLATPEGWVAFTPDGRYKYGGNIAGSFWHVAGLCRFEPGELDDYLNLRLPDDAPFLPDKPRTP